MITATKDELKSAVNDHLLATTEDVMGEVRFAMEPALRSLRLLRDMVENTALSFDNKVALLHGSIKGLPDLQAMQLAIAGRPPVYLFQQAFKVRLDEAELPPSVVLRMARGQRSNTASDIVVGEPMFLSPLQTWLLPLRMYIYDPAAVQAMLLIAYLDLGPLQHALEAQPLWQSSGILLLNTEGRPIFSKAGGPLASELTALASKVRAIGSGTVLVMPYESKDGNATLVALGMTEASRWIVLVAVSKQQAYTAVTRMQGYLVLWLALGVTVALVGALALAHRIGKPIREMANVTKLVSQGNFRIRVQEAKRQDEIGVLGIRLNDMILSLAKSHDRLNYLAYNDILTGLPNRLAVLDHLERSLGNIKHGGDGIALLFLDLDHFKKVNDSLGHAVGDQLLKLAATRLSDCLDVTDMAARLGGDEFLVVLERINDRQKVSAVANKVIEIFDAPFRLMDYTLYVGVSIGISLAPEDGLEVGALIDNSDMAMYRAKDQGRGRYQFFRNEFKVNSVRQLTLDSRLRQALKRDELEIYYQPIVATETGRVCSMEALVRWPDKEGGFVAYPSEFIPLAEETGLVVPLDEWVMDTACRQTRNWHQAGLPEVTVSVNVSARQFGGRGFVERVWQSLDLSGLQPQFLKLEVTERILVEDTNYAITQFSHLKERGIQFSVDDFGTGYSSLAYLRRFPLDYLKVAQEFVSGMSRNSNDAMIVDAVIALAKSLDLLVIAEGVETVDELTFLRQRKCDLIQGFFFSRPLSFKKLEDLLASGGSFSVPASTSHDE